MSVKRVYFFPVLLLCAPLLAAQGQDVDVPGNLTMVDSSAAAGNILKGGIPFIHNFGAYNTFIGDYAGNFTMTAVRTRAAVSAPPQQ